MKKHGWTMMEMIIALSVIAILSCLCVSVYKPKLIKSRMFLYGAMKNLTKGNIAVSDKGSLEAEDISTSSGVFDGYCVRLADAFNLKTAPNCNVDLGKDDVNITFTTGVTVKGLASDWIVYDSGGKHIYDYKDILVDIDGSKGVNKIWVDQFPLRVYFSADLKGIILPVNCSTTNPDPAGISIYCPASGGQDYTADNNIISFNVHRKRVADYEKTETFLVGSGLSLAKADCAANGGSGLFTAEECVAKGMTINKKCLTEARCSKVVDYPNLFPSAQRTYDTCMAAVNEFNPEGLNCLMLQAKPRGGAAFIVEAIIGDIEDMD